MTNQQKQSNRHFATVVGLLAVAAIHVVDLPGKFAETPYMAWMYVGLIVTIGFLVERLLTRHNQLDYLASAAVCTAVILGFVVNRTFGMPGATGDIGNWFEPIGLLSLFVESWALWQAVQGWRLLRRIAR